MEVYVVDGKGIDYTKYLISEIKKLNPKVDISATWVDVNHEAKDIKVYSSIELGKLRIPDGYFSNVLEEHILVPIIEYKKNKDEYKEEYKSEDFLNFEISENEAIDFANDLQRVNNAYIQKWSAYIKGDVNRQDYLNVALKWVSKDNIDGYMSQHRFDDNINELKKYFNTVIDWISTVFIDVKSDMRGLDWGRLYETYHNVSYNPSEVSKKLCELYADPQVQDTKGICEYILGGCKDTKLLNIRVFDENTKRVVYNQQTSAAKQKEISNCPLCALGKDNNMDRIWDLKEMDADHVTAWSKGGSTDISNCQMLCSTHNKAKGNR